jgi:hypothetical protein
MENSSGDGSLSRRGFLRISSLGFIGVLLTACIPSLKISESQELGSNYASEELNVINQIDYWLKNPEVYAATLNKVLSIPGLSERALRLNLTVPGIRESIQTSAHIIQESEKHMIIASDAHSFGQGQTDKNILAFTEIGVTQPHLKREQNPLKLNLRQAKQEINGEEVRNPGSMYAVVFDNKQDIAYLYRRKDGISETSNRSSFLIKPIETPAIGTEIFGLSFPGVMGDKLPAYPMTGKISQPTEAEKDFVKQFPSAFFVDADATGGCSGSVVVDIEGNELGILVSASLFGTPHAIVLPIDYEHILELIHLQNTPNTLTESN